MTLSIYRSGQYVYSTAVDADGWEYTATITVSHVDGETVLTVTIPSVPTEKHAHSAARLVISLLTPAADVVQVLRLDAATQTGR